MKAHTAPNSQEQIDFNEALEKLRELLKFFNRNQEDSQKVNEEILMKAMILDFPVFTAFNI